MVKTAKLNNSRKGVGGMKKLTWLAVVLLIGSVAIVGCKKSSDTGAVIEEDVEVVETVETKDSGLEPQKIVDTLIDPLCGCMVPCLDEQTKKMATGSDTPPPKGMTQEECVTQFKPSLLELLKSSSANVSDDQLNKCLDAFKKCDCQDVLGKATPPEGCEFLQ